MAHYGLRCILTVTHVQLLTSPHTRKETSTKCTLPKCALVLGIALPVAVEKAPYVTFRD